LKEKPRILRQVGRLSAIFTNTQQLKHLPIHFESTVSGPLCQIGADVTVVEFYNNPAALTDQKLSGMRAAWQRTTDEGVQRIQSMHEPGVDQKLQRSIDGRWRGATPFLGEPLENVVGADGSMTIPDETKHAAAERCKPQTA
jgi:hypothetical protein